LIDIWKSVSNCTVVGAMTSPQLAVLANLQFITPQIHGTVYFLAAPWNSFFDVSCDWYLSDTQIRPSVFEIT